METICQQLVTELKSPKPPIEVKVLSEEQALIKFETIHIHVDAAHQFVVFIRVNTNTNAPESEWYHFDTPTRLQRMLYVGHRFLTLPGYSSAKDRNLPLIPKDQ